MNKLQSGPCKFVPARKKESQAIDQQKKRISQGSTVRLRRCVQGLFRAKADKNNFKTLCS